MLPGLSFGTSRTSLFVANVTGRSHLPSLKSACGSCGLAAANTSAFAPRSICSCRVLDAAKLYVAFLSICVKTSRSDEAAKTSRALAAAGAASPSASASASATRTRRASQVGRFIGVSLLRSVREVGGREEGVEFVGGRLQVNRAQQAGGRRVTTEAAQPRELLRVVGNEAAHEQPRGRVGGEADAGEIDTDEQRLQALAERDDPRGRLDGASRQDRDKVRRLRSIASQRRLQADDVVALCGGDAVDVAPLRRCEPRACLLVGSAV